MSPSPEEAFYLWTAPGRTVNRGLEMQKITAAAKQRLSSPREAGLSLFQPLPSSFNILEPQEKSLQSLDAITYFVTSTSLDTKLHPLWPSIRDWTILFLRNVLEDLYPTHLTPKGLGIQDQIFFITSHVIETFRAYGLECQRMPSQAPVIGHADLLLLDHILEAILVLLGTSHYWFPIIWIRFLPLISNELVFSHFKSAMERFRDKYDVATLCVQGLCCRVSMAGPVDPFDLMCHLSLISIIMTHIPDGLTRMLARSLVKWVCVAFAHVMSIQVTVPVVCDTVATVVQHSCIVINFAFLYGFTWVVEALDNGILLLATKVSDMRIDHLSSKVNIVRFYCGVVGAISPFLIHRSVLHRVRHGLLKLQRKISSRSLELPHALKPVLANLENFAAAIKDGMQQFIELKESKCCSNSLCPAKTDTERSRPIAFKRCTGCLRAVYCSEPCRKIDWKTGHRQMCKTKEVPKNGLSALPSDFDESFARYFVHSALRQDLQELAGHTSIEFDLRVSPPKISTKSLDQASAHRVMSEKEVLVDVIFPGERREYRMTYLQSLEMV
ncbi:hypothetical protein VNI00_009386 [Paramarasmius palmivorus]|uniref:MYND-type domain-containing protein n=1 Tax=Paramarasmius palmivorus TaxID=297713 RepID=A0AAW0CR57_9AGAR